MATIRFLCRFAKGASLIANGICAPMSLLVGLVSAGGDIGASEANAAMVWGIVLAGASILIMAALICSARQRPLIRAAYCASAFFLIVAACEWCDHFNRSSDVSPPTESVIHGCLALLSVASLAMNRPLQLAALLKDRSSRIAFYGTIALIGLAVPLTATFYMRRIQSQYPYAEHFLRLRGGVSWENGWVVGVYLKNTKTTDEDLRALAHFLNLKSLYLSDTPITDSGLHHISELRTLHSLYLCHTAVTDRGVSDLSGLTNLQNLWLHKTGVTDDGLVHLERMTEMGYLDLGYTKVTDAGLPHLFGMKKMYYLHLVGTKVTGKGLRKIAGEIKGLSTYNGATRVNR